jgi:hypothetical protein
MAKRSKPGVSAAVFHAIAGRLHEITQLLQRLALT